MTSPDLVRLVARRATALAVLALAFGMLLSFAASARADVYTSADFAPSIWSDKEDYAPAELVTLSGALWQPGEKVHIYVNDDQGSTWSRHVEVTADSIGSITDQFNLPSWFVAVYSVTATGDSGRVATTSFTDADAIYNPSRIPASGHRTVLTGQSFTFAMAAGKQGGGPVEVPVTGSNVSVSAAAAGQCGTSDAQLPAGWVRIASSTIQVQNGRWSLPGNANNENFTFEVAVPSGAPAGNYKAAVRLAPVVGGAGDGFALCVRVDSSMQNQTITFAAPSGVTYGDAALDPGATASSGLAVDYSSSTPSVCTIVSAKIHVVGAGTCTVTASQAGNSSWNAAPDVTRSFTITKAPLVATADDKSRVYGDENPELTGSLTGVENDDPVSVSFSTAATTGSEVGEYAIVPAVEAAASVLANYQAPALTDGTLTVTKAPLAAKVSDETVEYGEIAQFSVTYDGFKVDDGPGVVSGALTCETPNRDAGGPYAVSCSGLRAGNYAIAYEGGTLTVTKAELKVNAHDQAKVYGTATPALTYGLSGFKNDETRSSAGVTGDASCTVAETAGPDAGIYADAITCAPGSLTAGNYVFATGARGMLTITKAGQAIMFPAIMGKTLGDPDFDPGASASSGLTVSYAAAPATVCGIVGGKVRITGVGTCTVTASQGGNGNYHAAHDASRSFGVKYRWDGFFKPIENRDAAGNQVLNVAKSGSTIPVKFSLGGDQGLGILAVNSPSSAAMTCDGTATLDPLEEYAATGTVSGLKYDALANQYIYNWKTDSAWAGKCRQLSVKLVDGGDYRASFKFTR